MNNLIKKFFYVSIGLILSAQNNLVGAGGGMNFGHNKVQTGMKGSNNTADIAIQNIITTLATFLTILAVVYALWGGFNILTARGDEDKVKKGKTVLIQALIGLVIIWLSYSIVSWLITLILPTA